MISVVVWRGSYGVNHELLFGRCASLLCWLAGWLAAGRL
jgi:hypothetical protein